MRGKPGWRHYRGVEAATHAHMPDSTTPKFARCGEHIEAIAQANNGKGFPFFDLPPAFRVAA